MRAARSSVIPDADGNGRTEIGMCQMFRSLLRTPYGCDPDLNRYESIWHLGQRMKPNELGSIDTDGAALGQSDWPRSPSRSLERTAVFISSDEDCNDPRDRNGAFKRTRSPNKLSEPARKLRKMRRGDTVSVSPERPELNRVSRGMSRVRRLRSRRKLHNVRCATCFACWISRSLTSGCPNAACDSIPGAPGNIPPYALPEMD